MNITKAKIKETAMALGMDMCGIASIDRFEHSDKGKHPHDILPGAKSAIVVGVYLLDGVVQANFRAWEDNNYPVKGIYGTYGYTIIPNFELTYACYSIAKFIERNSDGIAAPCSTGPMTNGGYVSLRHAAVAAGLGEFGWMGIVLTPEAGPRNRFGVIYTTLELEPDPMYGGEPLCNPEKCGICVDVCPSKALFKKGEGEATKIKMADTDIEYCGVDWMKCLIVEERLTKEFGGQEDLVPENATIFDYLDAHKNHKGDESGLQRVSSWHCGKCLSYCPAGNWGKHFKTNKLSKGVSKA